MDAVLFDYAGVLTSSFIPPFDDVEFDADLLLMEMIPALGQAPIGGDGSAHPWHEVERGERSLDDWIGWIEERVPGARVMFEVESPFNAMGRLTLLDERLSLARNLRAHGIEVAVVTNNVAEWEPLWRPALPSDVFSFIIDSAEVGMRKPDPEIYELALSRLDTDDVTKVAFIDDFVWNVEGARAVGMQAIHLEAGTDLLNELRNLGIEMPEVT